MKVGDLVKYVSDETCLGSIVEIGATMYRVCWRPAGITEWMPPYALELINEEEDLDEPKERR